MGEETGSNAVTVRTRTQTDEQFRREEELGEEPKARKRVSFNLQMNESFSTLGDEDWDLLPGLPNDITLDKIVPKLPWTAFHVLSSVSYRWHQAIRRSHEVHDARVRSHGTDELVVMKYRQNNFLTLSSMTDGRSCRLPCIPRLSNRARIPMPECCVSLNGKIYVLGGRYKYGSSRGCRTVYSLDLAGQREWRLCASMKHRRDGFGYGTKNEKIYMFGGVLRNNPVPRCEVYDPEQNSWSEIAPMEFWRYGYQVASFGEELFVFGGYFLGPGEGHYRGRDRHPALVMEGFHPLKNKWRRVGEHPVDPWTALVMDAYHPIKNKWRRVGEHPLGRMFMALGKFHIMTENRICVYDHKRNTWSHLHSINLGVFGFCEFFLPYDIAVSNDKLLVVALLDHNASGYSLFEAEGLGGENEEILFHVRATGHSLRELSFLCTIQL